MRRLHLLHNCSDLGFDKGLLAQLSGCSESCLHLRRRLLGGHPCLSCSQQRGSLGPGLELAAHRLGLGSSSELQLHRRFRFGDLRRLCGRGRLLDSARHLGDADGDDDGARLQLHNSKSPWVDAANKVSRCIVAAVDPCELLEQHVLSGWVFLE